MDIILTMNAGAKSLSETEKEALTKRLSVKSGDLLLFFAGPRHKCESVLGKIRTYSSNLMRQKKILPEFVK